MSEIKCKCLHAGQKMPYQDTIYEYEIEAEGCSHEEIEARCRLLKQVDKFNVPGTHNGTCGFPYGLCSYSTLFDEGDGKWRYFVTFPYDD